MQPAADHPHVAFGSNNLGQLLQAMGAYEVARPYTERALTNFVAKLG